MTLIVAVTCDCTVRGGRSLRGIIVCIIITLTTFDTRLGLKARSFSITKLKAAKYFTTVFVNCLSYVTFSGLHEYRGLVLRRCATKVKKNYISTVHALVPLNVITTNSKNLGLLVNEVAKVCKYCR